MSRDFNKFRFDGLNYRVLSNNYWIMNRFNDEETKCVVKVDADQLLKTQYGYALIIDSSHVVFVKDWQVGYAPYGEAMEVMLDKKFFQVKQWGSFENFGDTGDDTFEAWLAVAKKQAEAGTDCEWHR